MCLTPPAKQVDLYERILVEVDDAVYTLMQFCCKMHGFLLQKALLEWEYFLFFHLAGQICLQ